MLTPFAIILDIVLWGFAGCLFFTGHLIFGVILSVALVFAIPRLFILAMLMLYAYTRRTSDG